MIFSKLHVLSERRYSSRGGKVSKMYKRLYGGGGGYVCVPQAVNEVEERHFHRNGYRKEPRVGVGGGGVLISNPTPVEMN